MDFFSISVLLLLLYPSSPGHRLLESRKAGKELLLCSAGRGVFQVVLVEEQKPLPAGAGHHVPLAFDVDVLKDGVQADQHA